MNNNYPNYVNYGKSPVTGYFASSDLVRMNIGKFVEMVFNTNPTRRINAFIYQVHPDNPPGEAVFEYINLDTVLSYPVLQLGNSVAVLNIKPI
ncbi:hypothetical protein [Paenibacillus sp. FSL R5-0914]|uniref:hypothetical protein n=1 Tax=Paenibacillus sp. FSL R5-0914 TaxID=2921665 RepID=UPI0030FA31E7